MVKKMSKRVRSLICILFVLIFVFAALSGGLRIMLSNSSNGAFADETTSAKAMCVMESSTNRVLYFKNHDLKLPMASTTKIMTAITAIENCSDLDKEFEIYPKAVGIPGTSIYLRKGEVMSTRDLLYGLMLVSGNDASVAIAEHVGGNTKNFVKLMNDTARKIGAKNSHFDNTHGLDSKTHYTTAYDLALITSYAFNNPTFKEIVSTKSTTITNSDNKVRYLKNKNKLLNLLDGCNGVKTGFTNNAGRCLVSSCEREGMNIVCVVLNCRPMFEESAKLIDRAFNEYKMFDLTKGYSFDDKILVNDGKKEYISIGTSGQSYFYPLKDEELAKVTYNYSVMQSIDAPVTKGSEVGEIKIFVDKNLQFSQKIYTMEDVRRKSIWARVKTLIEQW